MADADGQAARPKDHEASLAVGRQWLTVAQISDELKVHAMTVYRLISAGKLGAVKVGRSYRVTKSEFERYLKEARTDVGSRS